MDCSPQFPLSIGFSSQEYWVGCHYILQGIFLTQRSTCVSYVSCIAGGCFIPEPPGKPLEIKRVNPKGNQLWVFIGRIDVKAPILWPPDVKSWLIEQDPNAGKRRRGHQRMRWLDSTTKSMDMNLSKLQKIVKDRWAWCAVGHGVTKSWRRLSNWTATAKQVHEGGATVMGLLPW